MKAETRQRIKEVMLAWVASQAPKLEAVTAEELWQQYPFHHLIFQTDELMGARFERRIVTSMGQELYPRIAVALARDRFQEVVLQHTIEGLVNEAACNAIEQIVTDLREARNPRKPNHTEELDEILPLTGGEMVQRSVIADLYIGDFPGGPLFVELKTPRPNLDIAAESKRKMLYFLAIQDRKEIEGAQAFLGLTYNPFGTRGNYNHPFTRRVMDMEEEVLIGSELWDYIGGAGAYDELLELITEIRQEQQQ